MLLYFGNLERWRWTTATAMAMAMPTWYRYR